MKKINNSKSKEDFQHATVLDGFIGLFFQNFRLYFDDFNIAVNPSTPHFMIPYRLDRFQSKQ
jgi:hypothetical protein